MGECVLEKKIFTSGIFLVIISIVNIHLLASSGTVITWMLEAPNPAFVLLASSVSL